MNKYISPKLIDKLYAKEIVLKTLRKWNVTGGGSFTDNEDMEANQWTIYLFSVHDKVNYTSTFMKNDYELAQQENISFGRILGRFLVSGIVMNFVFRP